MNFVLTLIMCSGVANTCLPPYRYPDLFTDAYSCMIAGNYESILKLEEINCYKISNPDDNPGDIIHYSQVSRNAIGVYTIYDSNFNYKNIVNFLKFKIIITDDIDKILSL